jgi:hypothetical protein
MKFLFFSKNLIIGFFGLTGSSDPEYVLFKNIVSGTNSGYGVHRCFNLETKLAWLIVAN